MHSSAIRECECDVKKDLVNLLSKFGLVWFLRHTYHCFSSSSSWTHLTCEWSSEKGVCVCVSLLASPFWKEAIASLHLLNCPIRYTGVVTHNGWVSVTTCCVTSVKPRLKLCCCRAKFDLLKGTRFITASLSHFYQHHHHLH